MGADERTVFLFFFLPHSTPSFTPFSLLQRGKLVNDMLHVSGLRFSLFLLYIALSQVTPIDHFHQNNTIVLLESKTSTNTEILEQIKGNKLAKFQHCSVHFNQFIEWEKIFRTLLREMSMGPPYWCTTLAPIWRPKKSAQRKTDFASSDIRFHIGMP